jgi:hypothetical protein
MYALVSCTKLKQKYPCPVREMYMKSTLFSKAIKFIEQQGYTDWYVLSAKYGLLMKEQIIEPYDLSLNSMKQSEKKQWSANVANQIQNINLNLKKVDFYAGGNYRNHLIPLLETKGFCCTVPLQGLGFGNQLQFYNQHTN